MSLPPTSFPADSSEIPGLAWDATFYYVFGTLSLAVAAFGNLVLVIKLKSRNQCFALNQRLNFRFISNPLWVSCLRDFSRGSTFGSATSGVSAASPTLLSYSPSPSFRSSSSRYCFPSPPQPNPGNSSMLVK